MDIPADPAGATGPVAATGASAPAGANTRSGPASASAPDARTVDTRIEGLDPRALEALAVDLAVAAGRLIVRNRPDRLSVSTKSSSTDVVTTMDADSERYLIERLGRERPGDAVFGEEGGARVGSSGITWVLDPIDGTVNYLYGIPEYAVSVAAVVGDPAIDGAWRPVAGAVAHPERLEHGVVYSAALGHGSRMRRVGPADAAGNGSEGGPVDAGESLGTSGAVSLEQTLLGTGFGYVPRVRRRQARVLLEVLPAVRDIRRAGSAALDLCAVAAGRLDAYYERGVNPWDYAAGWLVVTEAGGVVSGVGASEPGANGIVAAAPAVHAAVRDLVETVTAAVPDDEPEAPDGR